MARFHRARRRAAAAILAAAGLVGQLHAQDGVPLPPIGSAPPRARLVRGTAPAAAAPAAPELILEPAPKGAAPAAPPGTTYLPPAPDDGLGSVLIQPATPPAGPAAAPGCPCGEGGKKGDRFAKVPPVAILPRTGWFPIPPTGP